MLKLKNIKKKHLSNHKSHQVLLDDDNVVNLFSKAIMEKIVKHPYKLAVFRTWCYILTNNY
jgi:hypothetical protein